MCRTGYEISTMSTGSPPSFLTGLFIRNNKKKLFFSLKTEDCLVKYSGERCDPRHFLGDSRTISSLGNGYRSSRIEEACRTGLLYTFHLGLELDCCVPHRNMAPVSHMRSSTPSAETNKEPDIDNLRFFLRSTSRRRAVYIAFFFGGGAISLVGPLLLQRLGSIVARIGEDDFVYSSTVAAIISIFSAVFTIRI
jgi:hypothetical protein